MSDDIDRTDEYLELEAEEARRDKAITNGQHPDDPGPEPPPDEPHPDAPEPDAPEPDAADSDDGWYVEDGAELLNEVHEALTRYVVFVNKDQAIAVTLWIAATHGIPAWQHATRLIITSPQKRCGKSRLMDIVAGLSFSSMLCADATTAAIFRSIGKDDNKIPALHVDEADALWGTKRNAENNEDLRALFNAGWQRNRPAKRCVGPQQIPTDFNTFAMASFAAIGRLPDTIADRAVNIDLKRRGPGETVARFRIRRDSPRLAALRDRLTGWVRDPARLAALTEVEPELPPGVEDRAADAWEPLMAIADSAGGDWPKTARTACRALSMSAEAADDDLGVLLLANIRDVFAAVQMPTGWAGTPFLESRMLVNELRDLEESPWNDDKSDTYLTPSKLAKRLKPFGVKPGHNAAKTARGYTLESLRDAFRRYLQPNPSSRPTPGADQYEHDENCEALKRPEASGGVQPSEDPDISGRLRTAPDTSDDNEKSPEDAGQPVESDTWTGLDGTPDGNGSTGTVTDRRPGCVCASQPKPCYYCRCTAKEHAANTEGNTARDMAPAHATRLRAGGEAMPLCTVCGGPVTAGQGDTHLSCLPAAVAAARRARIAEAPPDDYGPPPPDDYVT